MERFDCVVVGAGWYGLAAAKQFYCTQPGSTVVVFDRQSTLGGKWAEECLAPGIKSNNLLGTYEYPDFPMSSELFDVKPGEHIPGGVIHTYLKVYADAFGISGFIRLNTPVLSAEHQDTAEGGWVLTVKPPKEDEMVQVFARRLIVATGLLSDPFMPRFEGQDRFGGKIFHSKDFQKHRDTLQTAKAVTVFGAGKSGWDAVYEYATAGIKVNWVIRSSGHGPCWMAPPYVTPFKRWIEQLANTRFLSWFSPCIWGEADGYKRIRNFYHGTVIGRFIVDCFWKILSQDVFNLNKYDSHPDTAKLKPWLDPMFAGCSYSILNYEQDFFELVESDLVDVYIGEITHLSPGKVHLADGTQFKSDVFFANTGWKHLPSLKFLPEGIENELGIPHSKTTTDDAPPEDLANQQELLARADREILQRFPRLKRQPVWNQNFVPMVDQKGINSSSSGGGEDVTRGLTPYMLYRTLVPPSPRFLRTRDVAFIGIQSNFSNALTAHISGLWISAYFLGRLANDPAKVLGDEEATKKLQYETLLYNRFGKWRYPIDWGDKAPNFIFDAVPYLDLLQHDLGLNPFRKGSWLRELYHPYGAEDYRHVNDEWFEWLKEQDGIATASDRIA